MKTFHVYTILLGWLLLAQGLFAQDFAAISFATASDYITTDWNPAWGADQDFSIDFSIRTNGWSGDPAILSDKDWGSGSNPGFNIALASNGTGIDVNVGDGSNRADLASGQVNDGQWHHVLISFDRDDQLIMWVDGQEVERTGMSTVGDINSPYNFHLGQDGTAAYGLAATCDLTNVRIWNTALRFTDLADIICNTITPTHPSFEQLLHNWTLQETGGTIVLDAVGGLNGTVQGNPSWTDGFFPNLATSFDYALEASTVAFANTSTDATTFWWQFGDGNESTSEHPEHTYLAPGEYTVTLTAGNACASQTITESVLIERLNTNLKQSIDLDGIDDLVQFENDLDFGDAQDFTIELLVRTEGWSADPAILANKDWASGSNPGLIVAGNSDGQSWKFNAGDGSNRIDLDGDVINDGLWHHLAISYDQDGDKKLYQDGELLAESSTVLGSIDSPLELAIGQDGTFNYSSFFSGQVAEVRIWTMALEQDMLAAFQCDATADHPAAASLLHYWKLDEGMGTQVDDVQHSQLGTYNGEWTTTAFYLDCGGQEGDYPAFNAISTAQSYLSTTWVPAFAAEEDFSIDFRIRSDGWSGDPALLSNKDWGSGSNVGFNIALASNGRSIDVNAGDGSDRADLASGAIADGEWHHVLVTFDRDGDLSMYIDGVLSEQTNMASVDSLMTDFNFNIGQDGTGTYGDVANCELSSVRVWSRVMEFGELEACSELNEEAEAWNDLLHFWQLNEGTGNPADSQGGQHASWQGEESWVFQQEYPEVVADFTPSITLSNVTFTNNSSTGSYYWDFGDGEVSTLAEPTHTYLSTGSFSVKLYVSGACAVDSIVQTIQINTLDENLLAALDFDGNDDRVVLDNDLTFGSGQDFTLELYVRSAGWNADPGILSNKDWNSGSNPGFIIAGKSDGTNCKFNIGDDTGSRIDIDGQAINDNNWHHIAVVYDQDGTKQLWQDGEFVGTSDDILTGSVDSPLDLIIGADGNSNYPFTGQVAEVRIWNTVLDSLTLAAYLCGVDDTHPQFSELLHYWKGDEGQGTTVADTQTDNVGTYTGEWTVSAVAFGSCRVEAPVNDIGAGNALKFAPDDQQWVDCSGGGGNKVSAASLNLPTEALTVECWVKPHTYETWHSMVAFIQDNGSFEKGWDLETRGGNKFAFALSTTGEDAGLIYLESTNSFETDTWYHVAGVFDGTEQKIYVNGVLENTVTTDGPLVDYADAWLALAMYKDDNENFTLDGELDEVRIWAKARTAEELRTDMCRKLSGEEANLVAYYRLDNLSGVVVRDYGPYSLSGEMQNMDATESRLLSGAALGDESVQLYTTDWDGATLSLTSNERGNVVLSDFSGSRLAGMHLYRVNQLPNTTEGIYDLGDNDRYYGTFIADPANNTTHRLSYEYTNYANALANESTLSLYNRANNSGLAWLGAGSSREVDNDQVVIETVASRREIILADFTASPCATPAELSVDEVAFSEATLSWTAEATAYNIQYGLAGFTFGGGTVIAGHTANSITLTALDARSGYDLYLQAICDETTESTWVGPFTFVTEDPCAAPSNVEVLELTNSSATISFTNSPHVAGYDLQWGTAGFSLGTGIVTAGTGNSFELQFLPAGTALECYVRANCTDDFGLVSEWVGPIAFTTLVTGTEEANIAVQQFNLYPNPTDGQVQLQIVSTQNLGRAELRIFNALGQDVHFELLDGGQVQTQELDLSGLAAGTYFVKLTTQGQTSSRTLVIR